MSLKMHKFFGELSDSLLDNLFGGLLNHVNNHCWQYYNGLILFR